MAAGTPAVPSSSKMVWTGRIVSGIVVLFLVAVNLMGIIKHAEMAPQFARMGYPESLAIKIPVVCIICAVIYAIPRTAILGAILVTAYLGGATATHVRIGEPFFFPVFVAVLAWGGIFLRDEKVRALIPVRRS